MSYCSGNGGSWQMDFKQYLLPFPTLTSERLTLRRCVPSDLDCFYHLASNPELTQNLTWDYHKSREETNNFINSMKEGYDNGANTTWTICDKGTDEFMGLITLRIANRQLRAEVGYWIGVPHWNKGYMSEALKALISFCFNVLSLNRIQAEHFICNPASGRVMQKCGMKFEGILREYIYCNGVYQDCKMYSILKSDISK